MTIAKKNWNSIELVRFCIVREIFDGYEVQLESSQEMGVFPCREKHVSGTVLSGSVQGETADGKPVLVQQSPGVSMAIEEMKNSCQELGCTPQELIEFLGKADLAGNLIQSLETSKQSFSFDNSTDDFNIDLLKALESYSLISASQKNDLLAELKHRDKISLIDLLAQKNLLQPRILEILYKVRRLYDSEGVPFGMLMIAFYDEISSNGKCTFEESLSVRGWVSSAVLEI
jgi:hypothetical protein